MRRAGAKWAVFAGLTLLLAAVITLPLALTVGPPPGALAHVFALSVFYGICIGFPATWLLPRVGRRIAQGPRLRGLLTMLASSVALTASAMLLATATLAGLGVIARGELWSRFLTDGGVSVLLSVPMSVGAWAWSRLVGRVQEAEGRRAQAERLEAEARFSSLTARLQPHFLFNTLNSIAALVREDAPAAERLVERLAALLRSALDASAGGGGGGTVPLQRELDLVQDYLEIERVRLGARLRCRLEVEPGTQELEVPPFALQTLVENAVKYAVAPRREGGSVRVAARREGGQLCLEVQDDGPGLHGPLPPGHGLDMLGRRLETLFGAEAELRLERPQEGGARVRVLLPCAGRVAA